MKRFLSLILCLMMVFSLLPMSALAEESVDPESGVAETVTDPESAPAIDEQPPEETPEDTPEDAPEDVPEDVPEDAPDSTGTDKTGDEEADKPNTESLTAEEVLRAALLDASDGEAVSLTEDVALTADLTLAEGTLLQLTECGLTVPEEIVLTVEQGARIEVPKQAFLSNNGTFVLDGELMLQGEYTGNEPVIGETGSFEDLRKKAEIPENKKVRSLPSMTYKSGSAGTLEVAMSADPLSGVLPGRMILFSVTCANGTEPYTYEWTSDNDQVISINSENGSSMFATSIAPGTVGISCTVTDAEGDTGDIDIMYDVYQPVELIGVGCDDYEMFVNETQQMRVLVTPSDAYMKDVLWATEPAGIATVDEDGQLTAVAPGSVLVRATAQDGSNVSGAQTVRVVSPITSIDIVPDGGNTVDVGGKLHLHAVLTPEIVSANAVSWSVDHTDIATVDQTGMLTGVSAGTVTVTAATTDGTNLSDTMSVTVQQSAYAEYLAAVANNSGSYSLTREMVIPVDTDISKPAINIAPGGRLVIPHGVTVNVMPSLVRAISTTGGTIQVDGTMIINGGSVYISEAAMTVNGTLRNTGSAGKTGSLTLRTNSVLQVNPGGRLEILEYSYTDVWGSNAQLIVDENATFIRNEQNVNFLRRGYTGNNVTGIPGSQYRYFDYVNSEAELREALAFTQYGSVSLSIMNYELTLTDDLTIPAGFALEIFGGSSENATSLTVPAGKTLTVDPGGSMRISGLIVTSGDPIDTGSINISVLPIQMGKLIVAGNLVNNGVVDCYGALALQEDGTYSGTGQVIKHGGVVSDGINTEEERVPATSIAVFSATGAMAAGVGDTLQLLADLRPYDVTTEAVCWRVENVTGSATIDSNGLLTALTAGTVRVTATTCDNTWLYRTVTVEITDSGLELLKLAVSQHARQCVVDGDVTLDEDMELLNMQFLIIPDGSSLTIPTGVTLAFRDLSSIILTGELMVEGTLVFNSSYMGENYSSINAGGELTVASSGTVQISNGQIDVFGTFDNSADGTVTVAQYAALRAFSNSSVSGIPAIDQHRIEVNIDTEQKLHDALAINGYRHVIASVTGDMSLSQDLVVPGYHTLSVGAGLTLQGGNTLTVEQYGYLPLTENGNITVESGASLINDGMICLAGGSVLQVDGSLQNNSDLRVELLGTLNVSENGTFTGNKVQALPGSNVFGDVQRHRYVEQVGVGSDSPVLYIGSSMQMRVLVTPSDAEDTSVIWSVDTAGESGGATISDTGVLTGTMEGTVRVSARAADLGGITGTANIRILADTPANHLYGDSLIQAPSHHIDQDMTIENGMILKDMLITVAPGVTVTIPEGQTLKLDGGALRSNGTLNVNGTLTLSGTGSENSGTITVSPTGRINLEDGATLDNYGTVNVEEGGGVASAGEGSGICTKGSGTTTGVDKTVMILLADVSTEAELREALESSYNVKQIRLVKDINLTDSLTVPEGAALTMDGTYLTLPAGKALTTESGSELSCTNLGGMMLAGTVAHQSKLTINSGCIVNVEGSFQNDGEIVVDHAGSLLLIGTGSVLGEPVKGYADSIISDGIEKALFHIPVEAIGVSCDRAIPDVIVEENSIYHTLQMTVLVTPSDASYERIQWEVVASDATPGAATIDENGLLTAVAPGTVQVWATAIGSELSAVCTVNVKNAADSELMPKILLSHWPESIGVNEYTFYSALVTPSDLCITWSVQNGTGSAVIDADGKLTGTAAGTVTVAAAADDGSGFVVRQTLEILAEPQNPTSIALYVLSENGLPMNEVIDTVAVGETIRLSAFTTPSDLSIQWSATKTGKAAITFTDNVVTIKGVKAGDETITAKALDGSGYSKSLVIHVTADRVPATGISIEVPKTLISGASYRLTAAVEPSNATNQSVDWYWFNDDPNIPSPAYFDMDGNLCTQRPGEQRIMAVADNGLVSAQRTIVIKSLQEIVDEAATMGLTSFTLSEDHNLYQIHEPLTVQNMRLELKGRDTINLNDTLTIGSGGIVVANTNLLSTGEVIVEAGGELWIIDHYSDDYPGVLRVEEGGIVRILGGFYSGSLVNNGSIMVGPNGGMVMNDIPFAYSGDGTLINYGGYIVPGNWTELVNGGIRDGSAVHAITVNDEQEIWVGHQYMYTATVEPAVAPNQNVVWRIISGGENAEIASVSEDTHTVTINPIQPGEVRLEARAEDNLGASWQGTFVVKSLAVRSEKDSVLVGETLQMQTHISPDNVGVGSMRWELVNVPEYTDENNDVQPIATINDSTGLLTANSAGTVIVKVSYAADLSITATKAITIVAKETPVASILLTSNIDGINMTVGGDVHLSAQVMPGSATNKALTWSVIHGADLASVDANGVVSTTGVGTITVRATAKDGSEVHGDIQLNIVPSTLNGYQLRYINGDLVIAGYVGTDTNLTIPASLIWNGNILPVAGIDEGAFMNRSDLTGLTLDTTADFIEANAFAGCTGLTGRLTLNGNMKVVADGAFRGTGYTEIFLNGSAPAVSAADALNPSFPPNAVIYYADTVADSYVLPGETDWMGYPCMPQSAYVPPTTVWLTPNVVLIETSTSVKLAAATDPANAGVVWSVASGGDHVSVDVSGTVTALTPGTAVVRATAMNGSGKFAEATVTVVGKRVSSIVVTSVADVILGTTKQMSAFVEPELAFNKDIKWTVTNGTGSASMTEDGLLTAIALGTVTVTAHAQDGSLVSGSREINIIQSPYEVQVSSDSEGNRVLTGKTLQMRALLVPEAPTSTRIAWSLGAEDAAFATINSNGIVKAFAVTEMRQVTVTASTTVDGLTVKGSAMVVIQPMTSKLLLLNGEEDVTGRTLALNSNGDGGSNSLTVHAMCLPEGAIETVDWKVSNPALASISSDTGSFVTLTAAPNVAGKVILTATATDGSRKTATLSVNLSAISSGMTVTDDLNDEKLIAGKKALLTAAFNDPQPTNKKVNWTVPAEYQAFVKVAARGNQGATVTALNVTQQTAVKILATAADGGCSVEYEMIIQPIAAGITIYQGDEAVNGQVIALDLNQTDSVRLRGVITPDDAGQRVQWYTSAGNGSMFSLATEDQDLVLTAITTGKVTLTAKPADGSAVSAAVTIIIAGLPQQLEIKDAPSELRGGTAASLITSMTPADETVTDKSVVWSVSGEGAAFASISAAGKLSTKAVKTAVALNVTASSKLNPNATDTVSITLRPTAVKVVPLRTFDDSPNYDLTGKTCYVSNVEEVSNREVIRLQGEVLPDDAMQGVTWSSSNPSVANVGSDDDGMLITWPDTMKNGTAVIKATASDGSRKVASFTVKVGTTADLIEIIQPEDNEGNTITAVPIGSKLKYAAKVTDNISGDGITTGLDQRVRWTVYDAYDPTDPTDPEKNKVSQYATITAAGVLTPKNDISQLQDVSLSGTTVTVVAESTVYDTLTPAFCTVTITPKDYTLMLGIKFGNTEESRKETATNRTILCDADDVEKDRTGAVPVSLSADFYQGGSTSVACEWISSNPRIAAVDAAGNVTFGTAGGTVTVTAVTAYINGAGAAATAKATCKLNVTRAADTVTVHGPEDGDGNEIHTLLIGKSMTFKAVVSNEATPAENTAGLKQNVTWAAYRDDQTIESFPGVTISASGVMTVKLPSSLVQSYLDAGEALKVFVVAKSAAYGVVSEPYEVTLALAEQTLLLSADYYVADEEGSAIERDEYVTGARISVGDDEVSFAQDHPFTVSVEYQDEAAAVENLRWVTSNARIASVSYDDSVSAYCVTFGGAVGLVTLTVTDSSTGSKAFFQIFVTKNIGSVSLGVKGGLAPEVTAGKTLQLEAKVLAAGSGKPSSAKIAYAYDGWDTVSISSTGKITAAKGLTERKTVTITAFAADYYHCYSEPLTVTVYPAPTSVDLFAPAAADLFPAGQPINGQTLAIQMDKNPTFQLGAVVNPSENPLTGANQRVVWSPVNRNGVAYVDENGLITAVKPGTVTITAKTADGTKSATLKVIVTANVSSLLIPSSVPRSIRGGAAMTLKAETVPAAAADRAVTWTLAPEDAAYATITASGALKTKAVTNAVKVTATATSRANPFATASIPITIQPAVTSVQILRTRIFPATSSTPLRMYTEKLAGQTITVDTAADDFPGSGTNNGDRIKLFVDCLPGAASGASQTVTWKSSNTKIATVDDRGTVYYAGKNGLVTITATATDGSRKSASVKINYVEQIAGMTLPDSLTIYSKERCNLFQQLTVYPEWVAFNSNTFVWRMAAGDENYATISKDGVLTPKAITGTKTVTVWAQTRTGEIVNSSVCNVTILPSATNILLCDRNMGNIAGSTVTVWTNRYYEYTIRTLPADNDSIIVSCSNPDVVVEQQGQTVRIIAYSSGTATISARADDGSGRTASFKLRMISN